MSHTMPTQQLISTLYWRSCEVSMVICSHSVDFCNIRYRCYKKCHWKCRWNLQMHQIYTGKQFTIEEFPRNKYHATQRTCRWRVLRRNWTKFVLDWRHLQGNHWTHLHNKVCDCIIIIIITNKIKLMHLHAHKTTVVYQLWQWLSAKLNFMNWYLQRVHAGKVNLMLVLFSDEAWFHHSWYMRSLKLTLTVMVFHGLLFHEVKVWCVMCYKCD